MSPIKTLILKAKRVYYIVKTEPPTFSRVRVYMGEVNSGFTKPDAQPKILKENASTAWVDGESALGAVVINHLQ